MIALVLAVVAGYGVHLSTSAILLRWRGLGPGPRPARSLRSRLDLSSALQNWLAQAGLGEVAPAEFLAVLGVLFVAGVLGGALLFGGVLPALFLGGFAASAPVAGYRSRRARNQARNRDAWPRLIDEMRILTGSAGRSIPQALFEVGASAPTSPPPNGNGCSPPTSPGPSTRSKPVWPIPRRTPPARPC
jgi:tight adherence protein B